MSIQGINGGGMRHQIFQQLDANGDGALDRDELQTFADVLSQKTGRDISADKVLEKIDANGDGVVAIDEMRPPSGDPMSASGAGAPSMDPRELLAQIDANGDGEVSAEERERARDMMRQEAQTRLQSLRLQQR